MKFIRRLLSRRRLVRSLKPCPEIRERRLRQMSPERRARAERNAREIADMIGGVL